MTEDEMVTDLRMRIVTDFKWHKYNFNIYTFAKSFNKIFNLFLSNVGIFADVW